MQEYLEAGKIENTHGVKGDLKVDCRCDSQAVFAELETLYLKEKGEYKPCRVTKNQPYKGKMLVHLEGVESMEEAMLLKNRTLYAHRSAFDLPEGSFFIADLIGTPVIDAHTEKVYGKVTDVVNYGGGDLYELKNEEGKTMLLPAVEAFVQKVEPGEGVYVTPIEGLLE